MKKLSAVLIITLVASLGLISIFQSCGGGGDNPASGPTTGDTSSSSSSSSSSGGSSTPDTKYIFATSQHYTGNLGGLAGADIKCNSLATSAGLAGNYVAWLSDSSTNAIDRILDDGPWLLLNGDLTFLNKASLAVSGPTYPLVRNENNAPMNPGAYDSPWTGTAGNGTTLTDKHCNDWSSELNTDVGRYGANNYTDSRWTDSSEYGCATGSHTLVCFYNGTGGINTSTKKDIFVTSQHYSGNLGGLAGADVKCNSIAYSAGLSGTFVAWLSTSSTNAIDRITGNGPWFNLKGNLVFLNKASITSVGPSFRLDTDEDGNTLNYGQYDSSWTGTSADGTNISSKNCSDWMSVSNLDNDKGIYGANNYYDSRWTDSSEYGCASGSHTLICFEQ